MKTKVFGLSWVLILAAVFLVAGCDKGGDTSSPTAVQNIVCSGGVCVSQAATSGTYTFSVPVWGWHDDGANPPFHEGAPADGTILHVHGHFFAGNFGEIDLGYNCHRDLIVTAVIHNGVAVFSAAWPANATVLVVWETLWPLNLVTGYSHQAEPEIWGFYPINSAFVQLDSRENEHYVFYRDLATGVVSPPPFTFIDLQRDCDCWQ